MQLNWKSRVMAEGYKEHTERTMKRTFAIALVVAAVLGPKVVSQNVQDTSKNADQKVRLSSTIDPSSLGLNLVIQLADYPQRSGSFPVVLRYSSKVWNMKYDSSWFNASNSITYTTTYPVYESGWNFSTRFPQIEFADHENYNSYGSRVDIEHGFEMYDEYFSIPRIHLTMPDGSKHELRRGDWMQSLLWASSNNPNIWTGEFLSVDGSGIRYNVEEETLYFGDGSRYAGGAYIDKHGNKIVPDSNWGIVDTMGREISNPLWNPPTSPDDIEYSLPGLGEETLDFVFKWKELEDSLTSSATLRYWGSCNHFSTTLSPALFGGTDDTQVCLGALTFNPIVINEIVLPDGSTYKFTYNVYGEIDKVVYPTGSYERYQYGEILSYTSVSGVYAQANRGVTDRWISSDGTSGSEVHWEYQDRSSSGNGSIATIAPDGSYSHRYYQEETIGSLHGFDNVTTGQLREEKLFDSDDNLLSKRLVDYATTGPLGTPPSNAYALTFANRDSRPILEVSIQFEPGNSNALATMTETEYDTSGNSDPAYFSSLNPIRIKSYKYIVVSASTATSANSTTAAAWFSSSDVVRVVENDYLYDSNYKARNINGLITETRIEDASGNVKARTQFSYDEGSFQLLSSGTMPTPAANSWADPITELGSTIGAKRGLPTTIKQYYDIANGYYIETHSFFDQFGNLRKSRDGRGNDTEMLYDDDYAFAYPTSVITPIPDTNGTYGSSTAFTASTVYDYNTGLTTKVTDPNGLETRMEYDDSLLRPTKVYNYYNSAQVGGATETSYGAGTSDSTRWVKVKSQIDETNWKESTAWFDGLGRTVRTQSVDDDGDVFSLTCYDTMGRVSKASNPFRNWTTQSCSTSNGTSDIYWTSNTFDSAGRPWKVTTPDSAVVETTYSLATSGSQIGTVVTVEDQADKLRRNVTSALGQLIRVDEPNSSNQLGAINSPNQDTVYAYDLLNNLTTVTQGSQTRTFSYDALSRLKQAVNPESGTINYTYDSNSNLATKTDARSIVTTYTYDRLNRVTLRAYTSEPSGSETADVSYYYDNLTNAKGKLIKVASSVSATEYTGFDILGRVTGHKQTTDGNDYTTSYAYNLSGAMIEQTYPSGRVVKNVLDRNGDLETVRSKKNSNFGFHDYAKNFSCNAAGAVTSMQLGNGRWESTQFNSRLQPTQIALGTTNTGELAYDKLKLDYSYGTTDNNGNVLSQDITVKRSGQSDLVFNQTYTYDALNRIKAAEEKTGTTTNWKQTFVFDRYGNRNFDTTSGATTTLPENFDPNIYNPTVNTANNRFASGQDWSYDAAGNVIGDPEGRTFTYDAENKQTEVEDSSSQTIGEYFLDGDGKRVKKVVPSTGETTIFVYDAGGKLIEEYSTIVETTNAKVAYLTNDHLGSPRINTDANGAVTSRHDYHPFGEEIATSQRTTGLGYIDDTVRKQFTGYERDVETNLHYAKARMFGSSLGRFTSPDPLLSSGRMENPQTWNRFVYVLNNPLLYTDPFGLYEWAETAGGSATDDDLLERSTDKTLKKKDRKLARRQLEFRQRFRAGVERAQAAATSTTLTSDQQQQVQESVDSYGNENDQNGVLVGIRGSTQGAAATARLNEDDTVSVDFNFNLSGDKLAVTIAHEGRHVADALNWVYSGHTAGGSTDLNHHFRENRAWHVSSFVGQGLNLKKVSAGSDNSGRSYKVWSRGWKAAEIETKRANGISNILSYMNLTPTDTDKYSTQHTHRPMDH